MIRFSAAATEREFGCWIVAVLGILDFYFFFSFFFSSFSSFLFWVSDFLLHFFSFFIFFWLAPFPAPMIGWFDTCSSLFALILFCRFLVSFHLSVHFLAIYLPKV